MSYHRGKELATNTGSAQGIGDGTLKLSSDCVHFVWYGIGGREAEE